MGGEGNERTYPGINAKCVEAGARILHQIGKLLSSPSRSAIYRQPVKIREANCDDKNRMTLKNIYIYMCVCVYHVYHSVAAR